MGNSSLGVLIKSWGAIYSHLGLENCRQLGSYKWGNLPLYFSNGFQPGTFRKTFTAASNTNKYEKVGDMVSLLCAKSEVTVDYYMQQVREEEISSLFFKFNIEEREYSTIYANGDHSTSALSKLIGVKVDYCKQQCPDDEFSTRWAKSTPTVNFCTARHEGCECPGRSRDSAVVTLLWLGNKSWQSQNRQRTVSIPSLCTQFQNTVTHLSSKRIMKTRLFSDIVCPRRNLNLEYGKIVLVSLIPNKWTFKTGPLSTLNTDCPLALLINYIAH